MIGTLSTQYPWLWPLAWQSTVCLAAGLAGSYLCRRRAARAHRILLLGLMAAAVIPVMGQIVRQNQWGLFVAERAVPRSEQYSVPPRDDIVIPAARMINETRETRSTPQSQEAIPTPVMARFKWTQVIMPLWLVASSVLLLRLAIRFFLAWLVVKRSEPIEQTTFANMIADAKDRLGIGTAVAVRAGGNIHSPVIWCWSRRPTLLIPAGSHQDSADLDWMSIICHELAHWRQRDHINGLLAELMVCILPWQPLAWWTRRRLVALSEEACDDWVITSGQRASGYARTLLCLSQTPHGQASLIPGVVVSRRGLAGRVRRILHDGCGNPHPGLYWTVAVFALAGSIVLGLAFAQTRPAQPSTTTEATLESAALALGQARTLRFPRDRSLGTVYVRDIRKEDWYEGWEKAGEAKGNVFVGAGKQGKLEVNEETAADLSPLAGLGPDDLQMLSFGWKPVTIGSLAPVGKLTGLQALNLQSTKFDPGEFRYLTGLQHLEVLRLGGHKLTDNSMEYVGKLTSLRSLALWGTGISDDGLKHLQGLTNLTFLALNRCTITNEGLRYLRGMTALEGLQLSQTKISDQGLAHLQHLARLTHINIDGNEITDAGVRHLEKLAQLENIWLNMNPISDIGFASLSKMTNLTELYATDTQLTDAGLTHFRGLEHLYHITIDGIGDAGIRHLSGLPSLGHLQILDAKVTKASVPYFQAMPSLEKLLLSGDTVDDDLLDVLRAALPQCQVWDPQRSREYPMPEWRRRFEAVYRLEEGEILKRIVPPFIPERMDYYRNEHARQAQAISRGPDQITFHWDGKLKNWGMGFGRWGTLDSVVNGVLRLKRYEYEGPKPLLDLELPGDWIIRDEAPPELKLQALSELIAHEFDREIRFEKRTVERSTIIATGKFRFHPPVGTYEDTAVHLWAEESDTDEGAGGGTADSLQEFLQMLGDRVNMPVVDRTEPSEQIRIPCRHHRSSRVGRVPDEQERARQLRILLDHLTAQTELQFEVRTQPTEIWLVIEPDAN